MKVNLKDPAVQAKVKATGTRWRLRDYENGLEISEAQAIAIGLIAPPTKSAPKAAPIEEVTPVEANRVPPATGRIFGKK